MNVKALNEWRNKNKHLFFQFPDEWVAFNADKGIVDHHADLGQLVENLQTQGLTFKDFVLKYVNPHEIPRRMARILPIRIDGVRNHDKIRIA
jgi:hypothetical protein